MAKNTEEKEEKKISFYIYNDEGTIHTKIKRIYSPHNVYTFNPKDPKFDVIRDPKYITFQNGVYETSDPKEIEFLDLYNNIGGVIEMKVDGEIIKKKFKGDGTHTVKRDLPPEKRNTEVRIEKQEVQQIPRIVAEGMTVEQLKELCTLWKVETADAVKKEDYLKFLAESGKLA